MKDADTSTTPVTLMFTILPAAEAGTRHFTEVADSKVVAPSTELESAKMIRQTLVALLKFNKETVTVTFTASNRAYGGFRETEGICEGEGGMAVEAGEADDARGVVTAGVAVTARVVDETVEAVEEGGAVEAGKVVDEGEAVEARVVDETGEVVDAGDAVEARVVDETGEVVEAGDAVETGEADEAGGEDDVAGGDGSYSTPN